MRFFLYEYPLHSHLTEKELEAEFASGPIACDSFSCRFEKDPAYDRYVCRPKYTSPFSNAFMPDAAFRVIPNPGDSVLRMSFMARKSTLALFWFTIGFSVLMECLLAISYGMGYVDGYYLFLPVLLAALIVVFTRFGLVSGAKAIIRELKKRI